MPDPFGYPATVAEVIDDNMRFRPGTLQAVLRFKENRPWRGSLEERKAKFLALHQDLCGLYGKQTTLTFGQLEGGDSGGSCYSRMGDAITLCGKLSVVTYLHEFAHALGRDERGACRWSINLFKRCFPRQFAKCQASGHTLVRRRPRN
jgi:hypothetical protein